MTAAVALAVVLVIAVAGLSLAMQAQRSAPGAGAPPRPPRPPAPPRRTWDRRSPQGASTPASTPPADAAASAAKEPEAKGPELLRTGTSAAAKVMSVVDERVVGPVTRSRLSLSIEGADGRTFEITVRHAFPTPAARSQVKVGGTIPVRYDPQDHGRVVVDLPA